MKKIIIVSLLLCSLLFVPVMAKADTLSDMDTLKTELIKLLEETIAKLQQQISEILAQQAIQTVALQKQSETITTQATAITEVQEATQSVSAVVAETISSDQPGVNGQAWKTKIFKNFSNGYLYGSVDISVNDVDFSNNNVKNVKYDIYGENIVKTLDTSILDTTKFENGDYNLLITIYPKVGSVGGGYSLGIKIKN